MTQETALNILKTGANVFLTGAPGSGKTYTINTYTDFLRSCGVEVAITASTGIAATHIGGMTIHSWSGIGIRNSLSKWDLDTIASTKRITQRIHKVSVLVIDEVSMLSPKMLTMIDTVCREVRRRPEPFGGLQVVFIGDFFQLPPVVRRELSTNDFSQPGFLDEPEAKFAYDSPVWAKANPVACYLTEQHRQDDHVFLSLLGAIRTNTFGAEHVQHLSSRKITRELMPDKAVKLYSHNVDVDRVNEKMFLLLPGEQRVYEMESHGRDTVVAALKKGCLSPEVLSLKVNTEVMFTKNNPQEGFVNGTLGTVIGFGESGCPIVRTRNGREIEVTPMEWIVEEDGMVRASISQMPLRLAWAITVHKSQGMSLDEAIMDLSDVFEYGQGYVALSRVRRLSGLHLLGWNQRALQVDPGILAKDKEFQEMSVEFERGFVAMTGEELKKMHENFVKACGGKYVEMNADQPSSARRLKKEKKKKLPTHEITLGLWREGKTVSQIAESRSITIGTVFGHIETLIEEKKLQPADMSRDLSEKIASVLPEIHAAFRADENKYLTPVFEKFSGEFSFDELRLARMMMGE